MTTNETDRELLEELRADLEELKSVKSIGKLNGRWQFLFKISVSIIPMIGFCILLFSPWTVWVTRSIYDLKHEVAPVELLREKHEDDIAALTSVIQSLPPDDWRRRIEIIETESKKYAVDNTKDHTNILISLEQIKAKLGVTNEGGN